MSDPRGEWQHLAACRSHDPETFFSLSWQRVALRICGTCDVALECLAAAEVEETDVGREYVHGVRGGLTARQRVAIRLARQTCSQGLHRMTPDNVDRMPSGRVRCKECRRIAQREARARR